MLPGIDINSSEFLLLLLLAILVIGPKRLPEYAAKLRVWVRQARDMAEGAKGQLKEQLGPELEDMDWRQYDPRQYDPRRIVKEALLDDPDATPTSYLQDLGVPTDRQEMRDMVLGSQDAPEGQESLPAPAAAVASQPQSYHPDRRTPFDAEAT